MNKIAATLIATLLCSAPAFAEEGAMMMKKEPMDQSMKHDDAMMMKKDDKAMAKDKMKKHDKKKAEHKMKDGTKHDDMMKDDMHK